MSQWLYIASFLEIHGQNLKHFERVITIANCVDGRLSTIKYSTNIVMYKHYVTPAGKSSCHILAPEYPCYMTVKTV